MECGGLGMRDDVVKFGTRGAVFLVEIDLFH
jgi:hypothetical protein